MNEKNKIVIYDTETTNSTIWGSIIEVGAVVVDENLKEMELRKYLPHIKTPIEFQDIVK